VIALDSQTDKIGLGLLLSLGKRRNGSIRHITWSPLTLVSGRCVKSLRTREKTVCRSEHLSEAGRLGAKGCVSHLSCGPAAAFSVPGSLLSWELSGYMSFSVSARSKCKTRYSGTLCGFVTLPMGLRIHKPMNGLQ